MNWVSAVLLAAIALLQYDFWCAKGGWQDRQRLTRQRDSQMSANTLLAQRNHALQAQIQDLQNGQDAIAEVAREELGYVQTGEIYYRIVTQSSHPQAPPSAPVSKSP